MAFTQPATRTVKDIITAAGYNADVVENMRVLAGVVNGGYDVGALSHRSGLYYLNGAKGDEVDKQPADGVTYLMPFFVPENATYDRIAAGIKIAGSSGSVLRLGIWNNDAGMPGTLVLDAGTVSGEATGAAVITISQALSQGLFWVGVATQGAPATDPTLNGFNGNNPLIPIDVSSINNSIENGANSFNETGITGAFSSWAGDDDGTDKFGASIAMRKV